MLDIFNIINENTLQVTCSLLYVLFAFAIIEIMFQIKHFVCDYPLQNTWMLKKLNPTGWFVPLFAHSVIHMLGTVLVILIVSIVMSARADLIIDLVIYIGLADLILHFIVDYLKAQVFNKWDTTSPYFWWTLGLDQFFHHLFNILFTTIIVVVLLFM